MMKIALIVAGVIAAIVLLVLAAGASMPQNHTASRTARFQVPPDTIWSIVTRVEDYPSWRRGLDSVTVIPRTDGILSWRESSGSDKLSFEAITVEPPGHFVARIADKGIPFGGRWDYRIAADGDGTRITITEHGEIYNPFFRVISRYVMGHASTIDKYLGDLAARLGASYEPGAG
jgi:hypothetical protein